MGRLGAQTCRRDNDIYSRAEWMLEVGVITHLSLLSVVDCAVLVRPRGTYQQVTLDCFVRGLSLVRD